MLAPHQLYWTKENDTISQVAVALGVDPDRLLTMNKAALPGKFGAKTRCKQFTPLLVPLDAVDVTSKSEVEPAANGPAGPAVCLCAGGTARNAVWRRVTEPELAKKGCGCVVKGCKARGHPADRVYNCHSCRDGRLVTCRKCGNGFDGQRKETDFIPCCACCKIQVQCCKIQAQSRSSHKKSATHKKNAASAHG